LIYRTAVPRIGPKIISDLREARYAEQKTKTARQGMPWRFHLLFGLWSARSEQEARWCATIRSSKMPKMKTKSAAKKRFKITATGKVLSAAAGKRHGMIKRSNKFIRDARGTMVLAEPDGKKVIKNFLPNGL
jgi:large subunit ribosomal protein L35